MVQAAIKKGNTVYYKRTNDYYGIYDKLDDLGYEHEICENVASWCELAVIGETYDIPGAEIEIIGETYDFSGAKIFIKIVN